MPSRPQGDSRHRPGSRVDPTGRTRRRRALPWIKVGVSVGMYVVVFQSTDLRSIGLHLADAELEYVAAGVVLYAAGQALSTCKWQILLRPLRLSVGYLHLLAFYFTGMFFNLFLPTVVGGDAVKALLLARETGAPAKATASVFMERNLGLMALLVIAAVAAQLAPPITIGQLTLTTLTLLLLVGFVAANVVIASRWVYGLVDRVIERGPLSRVRVRAASLYAAVADYKTDPGALAAAALLSFVFQFIVVGVVFLNARALNLDVPVSALAVFVPLISLAGMIPVTVNGLGVREALYILLFGQLGAPVELAVSLALLYLAVILCASLPGGLVYAFHRSPVSMTRTRSAADAQR